MFYDLFIIFPGLENVDKTLDEVLRPLKKAILSPDLIEQFKLYFKYLSFVACAGKAPIRQRMFDETLARLKKAGDVENIQRWSWWTPMELSLLEQIDKMLRVLLVGGNGTGKTTMLDEFATNMAKKQQGEVIFAIQQYYPSSR